MTAQIIPFRPMSEMPNRIRELRLAHQWSLDTLAEKVGCSKVQLSDLERGKRRLSVFWMERIAPALGVESADLLNEEHNPFRLSAAELAIVERYRSGTAEQRDALDKVAEALIPDTQAKPSQAA